MAFNNVNRFLSQWNGPIAQFARSWKGPGIVWARGVWSKVATGPGPGQIQPSDGTAPGDIPSVPADSSFVSGPVVTPGLTPLFPQSSLGGMSSTPFRMKLIGYR